MQEIYSGYNTAMDSATLNLNNLLANPYVTAMVSLFIILYAGLAAPTLPKPVASLFDHVLFKVLILALILYVNNFNPTVAILIAVAFFLSLQTLSRHKVFDMAKEIFNIRKLLKQQNGEEAVEAIEEEEEEQLVNGLNMETQVSGLSVRTPYYQGPQGMKHPVGFGGEIMGANFFST